MNSNQFKQCSKTAREQRLKIPGPVQIKKFLQKFPRPTMPTLSANSDKGPRLLDSSVFRQKCLQNQRKQPKKCSRALFCSLLELAESVGVFSAEKSCRNFFICTGPEFFGTLCTFRSSKIIISLTFFV